MKIQWSSVLVGTVAAGCVSLSAGNPVRPPGGGSRGEPTQDQRRREQDRKAQPKNGGDHDLACMIASGYTVNWDMDNIGWVVGVAQTRPHEPMAVFTELEACDRQADNPTKSTFVPPLPPELESANTRLRGIQSAPPRAPLPGGLHAGARLRGQAPGSVRALTGVPRLDATRVTA